MDQHIRFKSPTVSIVLEGHLPLSDLAEKRNLRDNSFVVHSPANQHHFPWGEVQITDVQLPGVLIRDWYLSAELGISLLLQPNPRTWGIHYLLGESLKLEMDKSVVKIEDEDVVLTNHFAKQIGVIVPAGFSGSLVSIYFDPRIGGKDMTAFADKFSGEMFLRKSILSEEMEQLLFDEMLFDSSRSLLDAPIYLRGTRAILDSLLTNM